jgi:hypothetical protein
VIAKGVRDMNGLKIIDLLEQVKNQRYTYSELVDEGIEVELGKQAYTVYDIDEPQGNKAYGRGKGKDGMDYITCCFSVNCPAALNVILLWKP